MNIIRCHTEILKALDGSFTQRVDRWKLLGWNFYTHWWREEVEKQ